MYQMAHRTGNYANVCAWNQFSFSGFINWIHCTSKNTLFHIQLRLCRNSVFLYWIDIWQCMCLESVCYSLLSEIIQPVRFLHAAMICRNAFILHQAIILHAILICSRSIRIFSDSIYVPGINFNISVPFRNWEAQTWMGINRVYVKETLHVPV